jgi:hypothetical protein
MIPKPKGECRPHAPPCNNATLRVGLGAIATMAGRRKGGADLPPSAELAMARKPSVQSLDFHEAHFRPLSSASGLIPVRCSSALGTARKRYSVRQKAWKARASRPWSVRWRFMTILLMIPRAKRNSGRSSTRRSNRSKASSLVIPWRRARRRSQAP